jgi:hypothetical protein
MLVSLYVSLSLMQRWLPSLYGGYKQEPVEETPVVSKLLNKISQS